MKFSKTYPPVKRLNGIYLSRAMTKDEKEKFTQKILSDILKAMQSEISKRKTKTGLILIEYKTEGMGSVGHSAQHGIESAVVSHYYYYLARFTSSDSVLVETTGAIKIYVPPWTSSFSLPRPRLEKRDVGTIDLNDYVPFFRPKTQFEPYYSSNETLAIIVGSQSVGSRLRNLRKRFSKLEINVP